MNNVDSHTIPKLCLVVVLLFIECPGGGEGLVLRAYLSQHGLHGEVEFTHRNDTLIAVRTNLQPTLQYPDGVFKWSVHEYPVDYRDLSDQRCSEESLGRELVDLTEELGYLIIPGKDHAEFESKNSLTGPLGLWGKSLVLETAERDRVICASIVSTDKLAETHAVARFWSPVAGSLTFRWIHSSEYDEADSYIHADLYHTTGGGDDKLEFTEHKWKIFVTDIFDSDKGSHEDNCNVLQLVFDPENAGEGMSVGDLDSRLGLLKVAKDASRRQFRALYKNEVINVLRADMEVTNRSLYVVVYDHRHTDSFLACAKLRPMPPKNLKALINQDGIRGTVELSQRSPHEPTWASFQLGAADLDYEANLRFVSSMLAYSVHQLPPAPPSAFVPPHAVCNTTGDLYNPTGIDQNNLPPPGMSTQDQYAVGDLLGKYKGRVEYLNHRYLLPGLANELAGAYWDVYLPLSGAHSVQHRSLVLHRRAKRRAICGTLLPYEAGSGRQTPLATAQVVFRYPLVGTVLLRQPAERPWDDTTIIVEGMVHSDGSHVNNTFEHRWAFHARPPGGDYYNWTARCLSAGPLLEPHRLDGDTRHPERYCRPHLLGLCRLGDLTTRHGTLAVAGRKSDSARLTRRLFTDGVVALAGRRSVLGRSLVLYDDHGPVARGERMACSIVSSVPRRKAVVRDWFPNGGPSTPRGRIEMTQQTAYDVTNVHVTLDALDHVHNYEIHVAPVLRELEFPCEKTTLYDTYDPFHVDRSISPPPTKGTADQYPVGDLGGKFGWLDGMRAHAAHYNDTQLALFGGYSVLGRSLVIHQKAGASDRRWSCASVERGYSPSEAREVRAIASFHHPGGFAWGYVRLSQLVHNDGSTSDTLLEVDLHHPGVRDRNLTHHHGWAVFVNPVGVDAAVAVTHTRCVAAGYPWNPYFTQLADPLNRDLYAQECGADNPLRCEVGDLTSRLGTISVGGPRQVFVDSSLPLEGTVSAVGRALVVYAPEGSRERMACANIQPDHDIVKYVNIMRPPNFVLNQFLESVLAVLGAPAWLVSVDARRTRTLHGGACVQLLLHFQGPEAHKLELDFSRLLASGRLDAPSLNIPGHVDAKRKSTLAYRQCGLTDPNDKQRKNTYFFSGAIGSSAGRLLPTTCLLATLLLIIKTTFHSSP